MRKEVVCDVRFLCLWSGPRNVSTALMYSFAQRDDTIVIDEPLYAHYLRVSGAHHPGREEVLDSQNCNGDAVMQELLDRDYAAERRIVFAKQMAHHLLELDQTFLSKIDNLLLIRDPADMLPSLTVQLPNADLKDTGLAIQWKLFQDLSAAGERPVVIDSRELLLNPAGVLTDLCATLDISFDPGMLNWPVGPRIEDGVWAKHWYHSVHRSSGFDNHKSKSHFPDELRNLLDECRPYYDNLYKHAIRATGS